MNVTASVLNIRSGPGTHFAVLAQKKRGDTVSVQELHGDWCRIEPCGWVAKMYLAAPQMVPVPSGAAGIIQRFGQPGRAAASAGLVQLPAPLKLGFQNASVSRVACHVEMAQTFSQVFGELHARGLWPLLRTYDGIYNDRMKSRNSTQKSTHAWGIAIDLNASTNRQGTQGDMDHRIIQVFEKYGFFWGGRWSGGARDPMHFQFAVNY